MNSKALISDNLMKTLVFMLLLVVFVVAMFAVIGSFSNGASNWADYYSKELSRMVNIAHEGDTITLDVQKATDLARKNSVGSYSEIFSFDNLNSEVCVKLSPGKKTCYAYFNNLDIIDPKIELGVPGNILTFKVIKKQIQI